MRESVRHGSVTDRLGLVVPALNGSVRKLPLPVLRMEVRNQITRQNAPNCPSTGRFAHS